MGAGEQNGRLNCGIGGVPMFAVTPALLAREIDRLASDASAQHDHAHLAPIWEALPRVFVVVLRQPRSDRYGWGQRLDLQHRDESRLVSVVSFVDAQRMAPSALV